LWKTREKTTVIEPLLYALNGTICSSCNR